MHALLVLAVALAPQTGEATPPAPGDWRELVELACVDCHGGARSEGGVELAVALDEPTAHRPLWERAYAQVQARSMPPEEPLDGLFDGADRAEWIAGALAAVGEAPGAPTATVRRLTRAQLDRVLEELLGVPVDTGRFLGRDASGYGFDTTGDTLFVTPLAFENLYELVDVALADARRAGAAPVLAAEEPVALRLGRFMERAFRRPPRPDELAERLRLVRELRAAGATDPEALDAALRATLLAPGFLYRNEATAPGDSFDAAARLALFLWGGLPDAELTERARRRELGSAASLRDEALRMLESPRARWLAEDFALQWLGVSELVDVTPDVRRFRPFNEGLRSSMRAEALEFFADLVAADRSVLECLDSDHVFVDARLAKHYGIEGVKGGRVRRVPVGARTERGGVLAMAAVHAVTSEPLRTSPVKRGVWVLERLLRSPPPPPPPDAGSLPEDDRQEDGLGLRARLERHRAQPSCAACHARFDPYGLALEAFDGIGRHRPDEDATATLPDGVEVDGPAALAAALLAEPDRFARAFAEHLFVYAVGRPPGLADHDALEALVRGAAADGYRVRGMIAGVAALPAFLESPR